MPVPKQQITVTHDGGTEDLSDLNLNVDVWLRENKCGNASITPANQDAAVYLNQIEQYDPVFIRLKQDAGDSFTKVFGGYAVELTPKGTENSLTLPTKLFGFEACLDWMRVVHEYGEGSTRNDILTVYDALTDNTGGVLNKYLTYVLGTAVSSGYSCATTYILQDSTDFLPYIQFPYTPLNSALKTLLDLHLAATGTPMHWTALQPVADTTAFQLCLDEVNNHTTAETRWPTDCPVTLTAGENIRAASYTKQQVDANYVVYFGRYAYPVDEALTESASANWTNWYGVSYTASDDTSVYRVGANSFKLAYATPAANTYWYHTLPSLDCTKFSTNKTQATLNFYIKINQSMSTLDVILGTGTPGASPPTITDYFTMDIKSQVSVGDWVYISLPLGRPSRNGDWTVGAGTPLWTDLDYIMFIFCPNTPAATTFNLDGLSLDGIVTRAAYESGASRYRVKLITDSLARTANISASDDSGTVAQLCKAEYLRASTAPTHANIQLTSIYPTIYPGQIIQALNYRIIEVHHHLDDKDAYTELTTTTDLTNSYPADNLSFGPTAQYNALMNAVNPDFQDRDRGSLKAREIDIDQSILAKAY